MSDQPIEEQNEYVAAYEAGHKTGRDGLRNEVCSMFWNRLSCIPYCKETPPGAMTPERAIDEVARYVQYLNAKIANLESALANRDNVDKLACALLEQTTALNCTHSERRGMIKLVQDFIGHYVGQRNGSDPVNLPVDDVSDIPF